MSATLLDSRCFSRCSAWPSCASRCPLKGVRGPTGRPSVRPRHVASASETKNEEAYYGRFGRWTITPADRLEVVGYRLGITVTTLAFLFEGLYALLPADQGAVRDAMQPLLDPAALAGATGLGLSLQLIHIYIGTLKRALQVLWAVGTAGLTYIVATQDVPAAVFVFEHPAWVWAVGPLFAALTGVAFKEGLCYNKWEAAGLFGALPLTVGGHLLQLFPQNMERGLLASCMVLLGIFAGRKYTQAFKDDIGDKSIFEFQKLTPEAQQELLKQFRQDE